MGKSKKKKGHGSVSGTNKRHNPIYANGHGEHHELAEGESEVDLVQRIKEQLQDRSAETRECGLQSLAMLVDRNADRVIESKLVRVAAPFMTDKNHALSHAAVGALRNLSLVSAEVCDEMIKQDVMTPLCTLLKGYSAADWTPESAIIKTKSKNKDNNLGGESIDSVLEIFVESVGLLWNLCEASPLALQIFNKENLVDILLKHLACTEQNKFPPILLTCVMQCLYTVSEENSSIHGMIRQNETCLEKFLMPREDIHRRPDLLYLQILALGTTLNVGDGDQTSEEFKAKIWPVGIRIISDVLNQDQRKLCNEYTSVCPLKNGELPAENGDGAEAMDEDESNEKKVEKLREDLNNVIQAQQTALEILTNICSGEDSTENEWEEIDDSDRSDDNVSIGNGSSGDEMETNPCTLDIPSYVTEALQTHDILSKALEKANMPAENVCQILREDTRNQGRILLKMLTTLRSRAFLCLNNLVTALNIDDLGGADNLFKIWSGLGELCFSKEGSSSVDLLESATSAMRAISEKLVEAKARNFHTLPDNDLVIAVNNLIQLGANNSEARIRINLVHITGAVGILLVLTKDKSELQKFTETLKCITEFLTETAASDVNLRVVAEALDKIFDIFGEDETDVVWKKNSVSDKGGLLMRLRQILPGLKTKIGMQKSTLSEEDYSIIMMAKANLARFIKYKEKRGLK